MKDQLISLYIDDELNLDEKIELVEMVSSDQAFKEETIDLLVQEKLLRDEMVLLMPMELPLRRKTSSRLPLIPAWRTIFAGAVLALLAVGMVYWSRVGPTPSREIEQRFVIYRPNTDGMAIVGSFTDWHPQPMEKIGESGYWSITLRLKPGEHHYSYMLADGLHIADPTVPHREEDDFGGENSIISVSTSI